MRIDASGLHPGRSSVESAIAARRAHGVGARQEAAPDEVSVSSHARLMALAQAALEAEPQVREPVVERAREQLAGGGADDSGETIARAMIDSITSGRP
ncbi:MAG: hypothetical protein GX131_07145 [candidate division WS1 bacterium]|jgi:anti-sigma28 factor (negative regulator of flagellin synthesis)|nr:hypothetical protein [candidate division WS1 bacterium]